MKRRRKKKKETGKKHIFEKVQHSEWASPTAPIVEANGDLWICGGNSVTINKFQPRTIPCTKLSGGKKFTKTDLSHVYHQQEFTPECRKY